MITAFSFADYEESQSNYSCLFERTKCMSLRSTIAEWFCDRNRDRRSFGLACFLPWMWGVFQVQSNSPLRCFNMSVGHCGNYCMAITPVLSNINVLQHHQTFFFSLAIVFWVHSHTTFLRTFAFNIPINIFCGSLRFPMLQKDMITNAAPTTQRGTKPKHTIWDCTLLKAGRVFSLPVPYISHSSGTLFSHHS